MKSNQKSAKNAQERPKNTQERHKNDQERPKSEKSVVRTPLEKPVLASEREARLFWKF